MAARSATTRIQPSAWRNSTSRPTSTSVGTSATAANRRSGGPPVPGRSRPGTVAVRPRDARRRRSGLGGRAEVGPARRRRRRPRPARTSSTRPTTPSRVRSVRQVLDAGAAVGELDVGVGRDHDHEVGRHPVGPSAPDAFQLGKYDIFTRTGSPTRSTSNEMLSSSDVEVRHLDRVERPASGRSPTATRCQSSGPLCGQRDVPPRRVGEPLDGRAVEAARLVERLLHPFQLAVVDALDHRRLVGERLDHLAVGHLEDDPRPGRRHLGEVGVPRAWR